MEHLSAASIQTATRPGDGESLTFDKLKALMDEGERKIDDMNEKLCRSLLLGGFRIMINDALPTGMIAVLPANFKVPLDRAMKGLRPEDLPPGAVMIRNIA